MRALHLGALLWLGLLAPAQAQEFGGEAKSPVESESSPSDEATSTGIESVSPNGGDRSLVSIQFRDGENAGENTASAISILFMLTALTLVPALLLTLTSFTRILIVLSFVRRAVGIQELPPNTIMTGMALFLTICVMAPTLTDIHEKALGPYLEGREGFGFQQLLQEAEPPLRKFLARHVQGPDAELFAQIVNLNSPQGEAADDGSLTDEAEPRPLDAEQLPLMVLIPAFVLSEVRVGFQMGFVIFLPFLVIDLVIASVLISMGMFMLPPVVISTPLKILLFVLVDGWSLLIGSVVRSVAI